VGRWPKSGRETPGFGKLVAGTTKASKRRLQVVGVIGDPGRARTFNPEIKSAIHEESTGSQELLTGEEYKTKEE
jgi:hypothetical protein